MTASASSPTAPAPPARPKPKDPKEILEWFDGEADNCTPEELHRGSAWHYLSTAEFDALVWDAADKLDPPLRDGEKIFGLGVGVGAPLRALRERFPKLVVGGNDISPKAIAKAKQILLGAEEWLFVADMTKTNPKIPDGHFDHVVSYGALGMYLKKPQMLEAAREALRMTRPGGSLVFTSFIRPGGANVGSIVEPVEDGFWSEHAEALGIEAVRIHPMKHQGDRYQVSFRKRASEAATKPRRSGG